MAVLDAIVRAEKTRSERGPTLGVAGNVYGAAAITKLGVATPNYCDLLLPGAHALEIGALAVQPKHYIFKHSRKAR